MLSQRTVDFLSSFGVMLVGVVFLALGSIFFTHAEVAPKTALLPLSEQRIVTAAGVVRRAQFPISHPALPTLKGSDVCTVPLTASSAVVVDDLTNTVLFKKNDTEVRSLASITKLMSALVLNDLPIQWTSTTVIQDSDIDQDHHISPGEKYTLDNLWHIALIGSSNSAIHALVRSSGLTQQEFVARMNTKAAELGLDTLRFVEPTGLDSRDMGTAVDIAKLLKDALAVPKIQQTLSTGEYDAQPLNEKSSHKVWSTDWLLTDWIPNTFDTVVGKTGYIDESGYNFVVRLSGQKIHPLRVVVLGAASNEARFSEARDIADWVLDHYTWPTEKVATVTN